MSLNIRNLATRLFQRFTKPGTLKAPTPNRARLNVTALEDRVVPTAGSVVSIEVIHATEGGNPAVIQLTRTDTTNSATVAITLTGTATAGDDYSGSTNFEIEFEPTKGTKLLTLAALPDSLVEGTETVYVTLTAVSGCTIGGLGYDTVNIYDIPPVSGSITAVRSDGYGEAEEGWVAENDDNDNYNFSGDPDTSLDQIADKDELAAVAGEDDLVAIHFDPITGAVAGDTARLNFTSPNIRLWMNTDKSGGQVISSVTEFDPLVAHTVYAEGLGLSSAVNAESVALEWVRGNAIAIIDQVLLTVYQVKGAQNVPGYSRHTYVTTIPGQVAATFGAIAGGTQPSVVPSAPAPGGGATVNGLIVNWGEGEVVGTYRVNVPGGFFVTRQVNVVKVQLDAAGADNKLVLDADMQAQRTDRNGVHSAPQYEVVDDAPGSMYASIKVSRFAGPLVDGVRRGQQFIDIGFVQTITHVRKRGDFAGTFPLFNDFSMISNTEGKSYIDSIVDGGKPWYEQVYDPTKKGQARHGRFGANVKENLVFDMADAPDWAAVPKMVEEGIMVGRFWLKANFVTYFVVQTREEVNTANDSYTIRASIPWTWDASGKVDGGSLDDPTRDAAGRPKPTGKWTPDANVTTLSSPVNPRKLVESTAGEIVSTTLTKGMSSNTAQEVVETWHRDPPIVSPIVPPTPPGIRW